MYQVPRARWGRMFPTILNGEIRKSSAIRSLAEPLPVSISRVRLLNKTKVRPLDFTAGTYLSGAFCPVRFDLRQIVPPSWQRFASTREKRKVKRLASVELAGAHGECYVARRITFAFALFLCPPLSPA